MILIVAPFSLAHLDAGEDRSAGGYIVDFGYAPKNPSASSVTELAYNLVNETTKDAANVSKVWLRVSTEDDVVFAGYFHADHGNIALSYRFPEGGNYTIDTKFYGQGGKMLVSNSNMIYVSGREDDFWRDAIAFFLGGIALGILSWFLPIGKRKKEKRRDSNKHR